MAGENVKMQKVGFSVHALNTLEQVSEEVTSYGLLLGIGMIYEEIQKIAIRANELHDKELDKIMNTLHLYEDMKENEEQEGGN